MVSFRFARWAADYSDHSMSDLGEHGSSNLATCSSQGGETAVEGQKWWRHGGNGGLVTVVQVQCSLGSGCWHRLVAWAGLLALKSQSLGPNWAVVYFGLCFIIYLMFSCFLFSINPYQLVIRLGRLCTLNVPCLT